MQGKFIISLDPATVSGVAYGTSLQDYKTEVLSLKNMEHGEFFSRYFDYLERLYNQHIDYIKEHGCMLGYETTVFFERGKFAIEKAAGIRAIIEMFCFRNGIVVEVLSPNEIKRFGTGRTDAKKTTMLNFAQSRYGYKGNSHDEADALHLFAYLVKKK